MLNARDKIAQSWNEYSEGFEAEHATENLAYWRDTLQKLATKTPTSCNY